MERTGLRGAVALVAIAIAGGCSSVPERMQTEDAPVEGCGYSVTGDAASGFSLEVIVVRYAFFPNADQAIQAGQECFTKTAQMVAARGGRRAAPIGVGDMSSSATRNIVDGRYTVRVTGKVAFAP